MSAFTRPQKHPTARPIVHGEQVDAQTRCVHWHSPLDVVAIRMACCGVYYACMDCHAALADHLPRRWEQEAWNSSAVLCGVCGSEMTVRQYLGCSGGCPACGARFNPGCHQHHHLYFETRRQS
jgi:uncharacterized CHY-type Zn-finger protein